MAERGPKSMQPRLILLPGTPDERVIKLEQGTTSIGRTQENDVSVLHPSLSRAHARIELVGDAATLVDLGSKNGTSVDGVRIQSQKLSESHKLSFGEVPAMYVRGMARFEDSQLEPLSMRSVIGEIATISFKDLLKPRSTSRSNVLSSVNAEPTEHARLQILLKVSQLLSSPAPLKEVLESMLELAFEILDIDRGAVLMVDPATNHLEARAVRTRPGVAHADAPYSRSVARWVIDQNAATLFGDAGADARLAEAGSVISHSIKTTMAAPLTGKAGTHGALYVDNLSTTQRFTEDDLAFLSAFASQAAVAMENAMLHERLAAEAVTRQSLLRFFPPAAMAAIMRSGGAELAVVETEATALFSDISGYTELSSQMRPVEVIELLNDYFPRMAEVVFRHEGTLEKYIGDALLAVWGAPLSFPDDPLRAVRAAVDMQRAIVQLNAARSGRKPIAIHIGISTGPVAAGNIGSRDYIQYATIGDTTNVASRICGVAQSGEIVIASRTAAAVAAAGMALTPLGPVALKGKEQPESVFRVEWT